MYCKYCGSKNNKNVKFCASCGKAIGEEEQTSSETTEKTVSNVNKESFFEKNKAALAVGVIIGIVLFILGNGGSGSGKSNPESVSKQFLEGLKSCNTNKVFNNIYSEDNDVSELTSADKKEFMDEICGEIDGYRILDSSIDGDEAEVEVRLTSGSDSEDGTLYLVRINNKWLIDMDRTF